MKVTLSKAMVDTCWDFSKKCAKHERPIEYGQEHAHVRDENEIAEDTFIGKLGEAAVQKLFMKYKIKTELDFRTMGRGEWDHNDINYKGWQLDIKCTKKASHYFLIELNKLQFRADAGELPHFFVMTRLLDNPSDILKKQGSCHVEVVGYIETSQLTEHNPTVQLLRKGDCIPDTTVPMTTDSYCTEFNDLESNWDDFFTCMQEQKPYTLDHYLVPSVAVISPKHTVARTASAVKYSLLLSGKAAAQYTPDMIEAYIHQGIKCILFVSEKQASLWTPLKKKYGMPHLYLYIVKDSHMPSLELYDGALVKTKKEAKVKGQAAKADFEKLCHLPMSEPFNYEQFLVEHAGTSKMMIVKASAGTGKTTVMIDRIMFLFAAKDVRPKDICMVTFTNHATTVMIQKLQKRMLDMYALTKDLRWHELLEELGDMQISTIDSFFNSIMQNEGSALGYGNQIAIKAFIYEKKRIIQEVFDEHFRAHPTDNLLKKYEMPIYTYVNHVYNLWTKLNSRGYFQKDIYDMDFGRGVDPVSDTINQNLKYLIAEAERRYQEFKKKQNSYAINDIKADMNALTLRDDVSLKRTKFKYLFIDEFQDTDNSQIHSAAWLQKQLDCQLFVVGDIKQSIYRFRGAKETAFDELKRQLKQNDMPDERIEDFILTKNYRTSAQVLDELNHIFQAWGQHDWLEWTGPADACITKPGEFRHIQYDSHITRRKFNKMLMDEVQQWMNQSHVCILTRTNAKVREFAALCRQNHVTCIAKLEGGFYQSEPVRDFTAMLAALLYPDDSRCLYNLLLTPYTSRVPDTELLDQMDGNAEKINEYLNSLLSPEGWHGYLEQMRYTPVFTLIEKILENQQPLNRYRAFREKDFPLYGSTSQPAIDTAMYELNLNKLMQIIYENFTGEYVSLIEIYNFLQNKIQTNTEEDLIYPEPENTNAYVECMTIHKAKGDEFETVIVPYTKDLFFWDSSNEKRETLITVNRTKPPRAAWAFKYNGIPVHNTWYETYLNEENDAVRREEARILYVALTRTKRNLICFSQRNPDIDSWSGYLQCREETE